MGTKMWLVKRDKYKWPCYVVSRVDETKLEVRMLAVGKNGNLKTVEQTNVQPYLYDESLKKNYIVSFLFRLYQFFEYKILADKNIYSCHFDSF